MSGSLSTQKIYDTNASKWVRTQPTLLSDFTARPYVIEAMMPLKGCNVLDLGCGEGYTARLAAKEGAASIFGIDLSAEMISRARAATTADGSCEFQYETADASDFEHFPRECYDRIMATFLFNYVTVEQMTQIMVRAQQLLAPEGRFVFSVPHPSYAFLRENNAPFYFESEGQSYTGSINQTLEGAIWDLEGVAVPVRCVHKTFGDYFDSLRRAGFTKMPVVRELSVNEELVETHPEFFTPLIGYPLHVLISVEA